MTDQKQRTSAGEIAETDRSALVPQKIGGISVPRTVDALEKLLAATKTQAWPLPFRADILPAPARVLLYSLGGIPETMPPNYVGIFAGRPYVVADGAIDMAIKQGCRLYTEPELRVVHCNNPASGCPGYKIVKDGKTKKQVPAKPTDRSLIATAHLVTRGGGRFTTYSQCCEHTWNGEAKHRAEMARTRALRKAALRAMSVPNDVVREEGDFVDVEVVEPEDVAPSPDPVTEARSDEPGGEAEQPRTQPPPDANATASSPVVASATESTAEITDATESTLFVDAPPPDDAQPPLVIGVLHIPPAAGGPHQPADDTTNRMTSARVKELRKLMALVNLTEGALEAVWKARYGFEITAGGTNEQGEAFEAFIREQSEKIRAAGK